MRALNRTYHYPLLTPAEQNRFDIAYREHYPSQGLSPLGWMDDSWATNQLGGWACDHDGPTVPLAVWVYEESTGLGFWVNADLASEPDVQDLCLDDTTSPHRFYATVPQWLQQQLGDGDFLFHAVASNFGGGQDAGLSNGGRLVHIDAP